MLENGSLVVLNMRDILPNRFQPRIHFDEIKLNELAESIRKYGVIQPIVVRQIGNKYEIIAGERRYKASVLANRQTIPAIITNLSDRDSEEIALLENIQRQNLTAIEEAVSYKRILSMGYITQEELAKKVGKTQSTIANKIRLLNLDDTVQDALLRGKISERHARSLLRLRNSSDQINMLHRIINERLTVKRTDEEINKVLNNKNLPKVEAETLNVNPSAVPVSKHEIKNENPVKNERGEGFMDIDKILNEAEDINQNTNTNPQNISNLMQPNPNTVMSEPIHSEDTNVGVQANASNKFVNFSGINAGPSTTPTADATPVNNDLNFNNVFNQTPVNNGNAIQSMGPAPMSPAAPVSPVTSSSSPAMEQVNNNVPNMSATPVNPMVNPMQQVTPQPIPTIPQKSIPPVNPINNMAPVMPTPVNTQMPINNQNERPVTSAPITTPNASVSSPSVNNIPSADIIEGPTEMPSMENSNVKTVAPSTDAHRLMQAINLIRNCSKEIENLGFYVDVDEINLDNLYQVTFKINKE